MSLHITQQGEESCFPAENRGKCRYRRKGPVFLAAAAAVVMSVAAGIVLWPNGAPLVSSAYAVQEAEYPEMAPYPDESKLLDGTLDSEAFQKEYDAWQAGRSAQLNQPEGYQEGMKGFLTAVTHQFLSGAEEENRVVSPLNVYMALAMLAETTGGGSRAQLLELLGAEDMAALRSQAHAVWNANYCDDGASKSLLANSLWLSNQVEFSPTAVELLADTYYASVYQGGMGSDELDNALRDWINRQTDGLLEEQAAGLSLEPETLLALVSTVSFEAKWQNTFSEDNTREGVFHGAQGNVQCPFLHQSGARTYYWGEGFSAVSLPFDEGGAMWLILPDMGVEAEQLLSQEEAMAFLLADGEWENARQVVVNLSLPKFDVSSSLDLQEGLKALGVSDIFSAETADFSPILADGGPVSLTQAEHAARVTVDEEGCSAAAYTVMAAAGAAIPPEEEIDFVLNRPFLFAITGRDGLPMFVGVVNQPL
ncbi:MAG TPA: hypothetical protein IAB66_10415 [Candidatus Caccousia avistercoris]|nr:hypothetical protein [Candidatus Caccousia avistercoris]